MRAIAVGQNREPELAISITQEKSRVTGNTAAVSEVTIAVAHFGPPRQAKARGFISPNSLNAAFELIELARHHLVECLRTDESLAFEHSAVEIADQPVRLVQHRSIHESSRPNRSFHPHRSDLAAGLFIDDVRNRESFFHV